jgi:very-short-patch-repair endonuclease
MYRDQEQRDFARQLRNQPAEAEKRLWRFLRAERLGVKFRRQAAIGAYIVDFVCFSHKLIVELDGPQHLEADAQAHDARRTAWLKFRGFQVVRFRNQELDEDIQGVVERIKELLETPPQPSLSERRVVTKNSASWTPSFRESYCDYENGS